MEQEVKETEKKRKPVYSMDGMFAQSKFSSLDERLDKNAGFVQAYVPVEVEQTWFISLMVKSNPVLGYALKRTIGYTLDESLAVQALPEVKEVTKYEPRHFSSPALVHVKVMEKIGRFWRKRTYWRLAGLVVVGRVDNIRCDGPNLATKETYIPANFRRARSLDIKREERSKNLSGQQKRYRIASVPMSIRFNRAVALKKRLESQAWVAMNRGDTARYDTLDNRANAVQQWLFQVIDAYPDLAWKKPAAAPTTDKQKIAVMHKNIPLSSKSVQYTRTDKIAARKQREARVARATSHKTSAIFKRFQK